MSGIDYDCRPETYFGSFDAGAALLNRIRSTFKRERAEMLIADGRIDEVPDEWLQQEEDEPEQKALERVHLFFMIGAYLPKLKPGEVEIARITHVQSVLGDVGAVYALPVKQGIRYRMVDEYEDTLDSGGSSRTSETPFPLRELVNFFDSGAHDYVDMDDLQAFSDCESTFYPGCDEAVREWVEGKFRDLVSKPFEETEEYEDEEDDEDEEDEEETEGEA
jgi:hypothetical protein